MNYFDDYQSFLSKDTVMPPEYAYWTALSALAHACGKKTWIEWGPFKILLNLYVILVGEAGSGKSSAITETRLLLNRLGISKTATTTTRRKLIEAIIASEQEVGCKLDDGTCVAWRNISIVSEEIGDLFSMSIGGDMTQFFTQAYDGNDYIYASVSGGDLEVTSPYTNLIVGAQPKWVHDFMKGGLVISSGFARRCLFIAPEDEDIRIIPQARTAERNEFRESCFAFLQSVKNTKTGPRGVVGWEDEGFAVMKHWYETHVKPTNIFTESYYRTKHVIVLKIASLHAIARRSMKISPEDVQKSLKLLREMELTLPALFSGAGRNETYGVAQSIQKMVVRQKKVHEREIYRAFMQHVKNEWELELVLKALHKACLIQPEGDYPNNHWVPFVGRQKSSKVEFDWVSEDIE